MLAALNHPNVLRFYGVVTASASEQTVVGIMTEYMPGGSLSNYLRCAPCILNPPPCPCQGGLAPQQSLFLHVPQCILRDPGSAARNTPCWCSSTRSFCGLPLPGSAAAPRSDLCLLSRSPYGPRRHDDT